MRAVAAALCRRRWAWAATLGTVLTGMAYSLLWGPIVRHQTGWITPGDLWASYRGAHYVAWGALGDVYSAQTALVSFPGLLIVLAPVSMLTGALGLSEAFPLNVAHPTAWIILGPVTLLMAAAPLCALDALAEERGLRAGRRRTLMAVEGAALWGMLCLWGHPEDALALGLVLYALLLTGRGAWVGAGWLIGLAVAVQPLSLLVLPAVLGTAPVRNRVGTLVRAALPAGVLVSILLVSDFGDTWIALTRQPNYPTIDHPTPWVHLSPALSRVAVASGPGRMLAVLCAIGIGTWVWRSRAQGRGVDVVSAACLALAARCVFEPVMVPYYVTPAVTLAMLLSWDRGRARLVAGASLGMALTVTVYLHSGPLRWWLEMMGLLIALVLLAGGLRVPRVADRRKLSVSRRLLPTG